jgi:membrane-bound serine protease (ClpP class)
MTMNMIKYTSLLSFIFSLLVIIHPAFASSIDTPIELYNSPFLALMGLALMVLEFALPTKGILGFIGITLFLTGTASLADYPNEDWRMSWSMIIIMDAIVTITALSVTWYTIKGYNRKIDTSVTEPLIGQIATVIEWDENQQRVEAAGSVWQAISPHPFRKGDKVKIIAQNNLTLSVVSAGEIL